MASPSRSGSVAVFPTPVGVFPAARYRRWMPRSLPHARGGVSVRLAPVPRLGLSSPRPWGCFSSPHSTSSSGWVFPTPVGVFPSSRLTPLNIWSLPHARGGVSDGSVPVVKVVLSSPRPWGCFSGEEGRRSGKGVFPTPVGVFPVPAGSALVLAGLPHARGGVSTTTSAAEKAASSPRPWGCFSALRQKSGLFAVFPTPVGVFLFDRLRLRQMESLPHARGGVS